MLQGEIITEVFRQFGTPYRYRPRHFSTSRNMCVDHIAIGIMLDLETARIRPVVKDLTSQDMPAYSPDTLPALLAKPLMAEQLGVKVGYLIRAVVYIRLLDLWWGALKEENVMIGEFVSKIKMDECKDIHVGKVGVEKDIRRDKVEVGSIEVKFIVEFLAHVSEMTEFVHQSWPTVISLELA